MVGKTIYFHEKYFKMTEWDTVRGKVAIEPNDVDLVELLRQVMIANTPLLYYYNRDIFVVIHPNSPSIRPAG